MTKTEFTLLLQQFNERKQKAIKMRDEIKFNKKTILADTVKRNYLQGGIDTLSAIIEGFEKQQNKFT